MTWLRLIHTDLPKLVKQRYDTEFSLDSLLSEIRTADDAEIMRAAATNRTYNSSLPHKPSFGASAKMLMRMRNHALFVNKLAIRATLTSSACANACPNRTINSCRRQDRSSLCLTKILTTHLCAMSILMSHFLIDTFYKHHHALIILDTGATCNMIRLSAARRLGAHMTPSS